MTHARVLAGRLADLLRREQAAMAEFLVALADFDRRRAWVELGHSSLFYFLHRELGLSTGAAYYRKTAAHLVQKFPEIVEPLRDGRLCITSVVALAKVLTPENRHETLPRFFQRSKRQAQALAAALQPATAAPHRDVVTAVRAVAPPPVQEAAPVEPGQSHPFQPVETDLSQPTQAQAPARTTVPAAAPLLPKPARRDAAEPLTEDLSRIHVTVCRRFLEKLEAARAALSHSRPGATNEGILEAGLDLLLERHAKRRGLVKKPQNKTRPCVESHIPAAVKREVWTRDEGRCQWPVQSGGICGSTQRVEFGHRTSKALGGGSTANDLRLLCRFHNQLEAKQVFGDDFMNQFTRNAPHRRSVGPQGAAQAPAGTVSQAAQTQQTSASSASS
jgi:hypothetical protein